MSSIKNKLNLETMRDLAYTMYIAGVPIETIAASFKRSSRTIHGWRKKYSWDTDIEDMRVIDKKIQFAAKKALLRTLEEYEKNPRDVDLKLLVNQLRENTKQADPKQYVEETLKKYVSMTVKFFIVKGLDDLRKGFQQNLHEISEYIAENL